MAESPTRFMEQTTDGHERDYGWIPRVVWVDMTQSGFLIFLLHYLVLFFLPAPKGY